MTATDQLLVQTLVNAGVLSPAHVKRMHAEQQKWGGKLHHYASDLGLVREDHVSATLARALNVPQVRLAEIPVDDAALKLVSSHDCERFTLFPCALRDDGKTLWLAMSDPLDVAAMEFVRARARVARVLPGVSGKQEIVAAIHRSYTVLGRAVSLEGHGVAPVAEEFKIVDTAGRTQVRHINDILPPPAQQTPPVVVGGAPLPIGSTALSAPPRAKAPLATILLDAGVVDTATLGRASSIAVAGDVPVVFALARWRLAEPARIAAALSRALAVPVISIDSLAQAPALPVARAACVRMRVLPLWRSGNIVGVAMTDPTDDASVEALASAHQVTVERLLVDDDALERAFAALATRGEAGNAPPPLAPVVAYAPNHAPAAQLPATLAATPPATPPAGPPASGELPVQPRASASTSLPMPLSAMLSLTSTTASPPPVAESGDAGERLSTSPVGGLPSGRTVLSIVEGVLANSSPDDNRSDGDVFRAADVRLPTQTGPTTVDLAGATFDGPTEGGVGRVGTTRDRGVDRTVNADMLEQLRVLAVAGRANGAILRAGLQPRVGELVVVSRLGEAIERAQAGAFHEIVVVDPPDRVVRSKEFAALAALGRRGLFVVASSSSTTNRPDARADVRADVRYVALDAADDLIDVVIAELRDALLA